MVEDFSQGCRSGYLPFDNLTEDEKLQLDETGNNLRRSEMSRVKGEPAQATEIELERVIEPLASYICAADQPRAVLMSALAVLFGEVDKIDQAAIAQIAIFSGSPSS
jgi:hypothetical protein